MLGPPGRDEWPSLLRSSSDVPLSLGAIDEALAQLERPESGALELVGEPGIGKTRLLGELAARADGQGRIVLSGSASELERELPFWVFVDALDEYVQGLEPRRLDALDATARVELAQVFPSFPADGEGEVPVLQDQRYRTHRAVRQLLESLAATKPLVLVLDDLHWADSGSIELLGACCAGPRRLRSCSRSPSGRARSRSGCRARSSAPTARAP
jgi:predicted ATPase